MVCKVNGSIYGYPVRRQLFPGEQEYFEANPTVSGMAAEDGAIILNPYSKLSPKELESVAENEAIRLFMREKQIYPDFNVTDEQRKFFKDTPYTKDPVALRQTIVGRILSGDPSISGTSEQKTIAQNIFERLKAERGN